MRKGFVTVLCMILAVSIVLTACGSANNEAAPEQREQTPPSDNESVLHLNIHAEPLSLNPGDATDVTSFLLLKSLMEGLTRVEQDGTPREAGAKTIDVSDDLKTYTFTLRDYKWTNGDPVTAQDYEYAWKWVLDPSNEAPYAYQLYSILNAKKAKAGEAALEEVGIKAVNEKTLVVTLTNPTPYFLELTAFPTFYPINKRNAEANPAWHTEAVDYVGNGPFTLKEWTHGVNVVMERNADYWDADTVKMDRVEMAIIEDIDMELRMFKDGELDWAGSPFSELPTDALPELESEGEVTTMPIAGTYIFKFNTQKPPFNNANIRKAFAYAIDRKMIVEDILQGGQIPAMAYVPPTVFQENQQGLFKDNNVEEAKKLLAQGMKELGITELPAIELSYNTNEAHAKLSQAIQDMWEQRLGAEVTLSNAEWEVHLENVRKGNYHVSRMSWLGDFNDAINFLEMYTQPEGNNNTYWTNKKYNELIFKSFTEADAIARQQLMKDAETILLNEMPIIPIYYYTYSYVMNDRVKDVYIDGLGNVDLKWSTIK